MAKPSRGGLGRGLTSLMGNPTEAPIVQEKAAENPEANNPARTTNRDRIVYDAQEDVVYETVSFKDSETQTLNPGSTGRIDIYSKSEDSSDTSVSRETSEVRERIPEPPYAQDKKEDKADVDNVIYSVDIESVIPNPEQPRTNFNQDDLRELANSIKRDGLIQPILVRETEDGYQIIAGERRWQASKLAGLDKVPIQVKNVNDEKALELALIENIQRSDLNPIEEAYGYKRLMERNKMTQADIAQAVSKGRSTIANALRLLELPEDAQQLLFEDKITAGHARAILSIPDKESRVKLTRKLAENKLSVRETENIARLMAHKPDKQKPRDPAPAVYKSVARALKETLNAEVKVKSNNGKNKIEIEFKDERDLERLFGIICPD